MTHIDFLDQLGRELDGAAGRLIRDQRRSRFRAVLAQAAALAVIAAIAVAVWPNAPADPEREVRPATPQNAADVLGVLRRPETEADRGPAAQDGRKALARSLSADAVFRLVGTTDDGRGIMIGAASEVERHGGGPPGAGVCLHYPDSLGGGGGACWTADDIAKGHSYGNVGDDFNGLAPDGVERVIVVTAEGEETLPVRDNFFQARIGNLPEIAAVIMHDEKGRPVAQDLRGAAHVPVVPVPEETLQEAEAIVDIAPPPPGEGPLAEVLESARVTSGRTPYPPGMRDEFTWTQSHDDETSIPDVQFVIEFRAQCMWQRYWLAAVQAGDEAVAAQAAAVLKTAPGWPALRSKPEPHELIAFTVANQQTAAVAREVAVNCADVPPAPRPEP